MSLIQIKGKSVLIKQSAKKLTDGEIALLALIKKKIETDTVIYESDYVKIYKYHVLRRKDKSDCEYKNGEWKYFIREYYIHEIESQAKQWFISALGRLIIKAKLVVIPIIDMEL